MITLLWEMTAYAIDIIWFRCICGTFRFFMKHWWLIPVILALIAVTLVVLILLI